MSWNGVIDGLLTYIYLLIVLTFHEFAHAWAAWKCGDDTARLQGRVTLNPVAHMDLLGTIILPLLVVFLGAADSKVANFIVGWGKPVPVNIDNLRHRRRDDTLVSLAGPIMNLLLALGLMGVAKGLHLAHLDRMMDVALTMSLISLMLCFFNLIPIPPLDGSHVLKNFIGMSDEMYLNFCRFGFIAVILVIQIPFVRGILSFVTFFTFAAMGRLVGLA